MTDGTVQQTDQINMEVCTTPNLDYGRREDVTAPHDTTLYVSDNQDNLPITLQRKVPLCGHRAHDALE